MYIQTFNKFFEVAYVSPPNRDDLVNQFLAEHPDTGVLAVDNLLRVYVAFKAETKARKPSGWLNAG